MSEEARKAFKFFNTLRARTLEVHGNLGRVLDSAEPKVDIIRDRVRSIHQKLWEAADELSEIMDIVGESEEG